MAIARHAPRRSSRQAERFCLPALVIMKTSYLAFIVRQKLASLSAATQIGATNKELIMPNMSAAIQSLEDEIETALHQYEMQEQLQPALAAYFSVEERINNLEIAPGHPDYPAVQGTLAYCLMREGNILRQLGQVDQANLVNEREIAAARASGNRLTLGRSLMSSGATQILTGKKEQGLASLEEARAQFEQGAGDEFRQGLGWYWIIQADLVNAGLVEQPPEQAIHAANQALEILTPIENWPGVVRAFEARARAHEHLGHLDAAKADRQASEQYKK
jgi:tetratricopeptide (TPR) repeat protein